jgi:hypothetical protein
MRGRAISLIVCSWSILLVAAALVPWQDAATAQPVPAPTSAPPPGYPEPSEPTYHGNGELWTVPWPNGRVVFAPGGPGFVPTDGSLYLIFPTPGCWEITGRVGETSLTFVTVVVKIGEGPTWRPAAAP